MRQYFGPSPNMDAEAVAFLHAHGVKPHETFNVVNARHGSKGVEQAVIQPEEFVEPMQQMAACLRTRHVYLVTETAETAQRMLDLGKQNGFNIFTVKYTYPGADIWNKQLVQQQQTAGPSLREIGYVSAKVLAVTRRGSGFIGTLQSSWAKVSLAAMYGYHRRPVPSLSLRPTWGFEHGYRGQDSAFWSMNGSSGARQPWPCV